MAVEILTRDLWDRRRGLVAYSAGMVLYVLVVVAIYPAFKDSSSLDKLTESNAGLAAVFGITSSLTSSVGWLSANVYANFFPLVILLLTIGYGSQCLAGQEESGHLELVLSLPFRRRTVVLTKMGALAIQAAIFAATVFAASLCGLFFEMSISGIPLATTTLGVALMAIDLGLLAMALGAGTGNRGLAIGITTAVAAASYLISSLASVVAALQPFRFLSLFYWAVGDDQLERGLGLGSFAVLAIVGVALGAVAVLLFERHDLRA